MTSELTRSDAWAQLCEWTEGESLRRHARSVEIVMRAAAQRYGEGASDVEEWGIAGMLQHGFCVGAACPHGLPQTMCAQRALEPEGCPASELNSRLGHCCLLGGTRA